MVPVYFVAVGVYWCIARLPALRYIFLSFWNEKWKSGIPFDVMQPARHIAKVVGTILIAVISSYHPAVLVYMINIADYIALANDHSC